jgi:hypothetical protein
MPESGNRGSEGAPIRLRRHESIVLPAIQTEISKTIYSIKLYTGRHMHVKHLALPTLDKKGKLGLDLPRVTVYIP